MISPLNAASGVAAAAAFPDILLNPDAASDISLQELLPDALHVLRTHLGMDVAFIGEFDRGERVFRYVDADDPEVPIMVGVAEPLELTYCQRIVDGRLPELIQDAACLPAAVELPATAAFPIGAHLSVPIRFSDGNLYGTFCCFRSAPDPSLHDRDLAMLRMFADFAGRQLERMNATRTLHATMTARVQAALAANSFTIVYQPLYHFGEDRIIGFEALTRCSAAPRRSPDCWFAEAAQVGLGEYLEMHMIEQALAGLPHLAPDTYLSLNTSPEHILSGAIERTLAEAPLERIVLEVTEHVPIPEYAALAQALAPLQQRGVRLAIDDAGAGYASFRHILNLAPDVIKLDMSLTQAIDTDQARRALTAALIRFAEETGRRVIAEGVETEAELRELRRLGVTVAQGYLIGPPLPLLSLAR